MSTITIIIKNKKIFKKLLRWHIFILVIDELTLCAGREKSNDMGMICHFQFLKAGIKWRFLGKDLHSLHHC